MSIEFFEHLRIGRLKSPPVTLVGDDPETMRTDLARQMGCLEAQVERKLKAMLGKPETFRATPREMRKLVERDLDRDREAPCRKRGTEGRATEPDPVINDDSMKDGKESLEDPNDV